MSLLSRKVFWLLGVTTIVALGTLPLGAQEPKKVDPVPAGATPPPPVAGKGSDQARRVPSFFGQIGLTSEQREEIYKVRAKYLQKLSELDKQVAALRTQMMDECEKVLNDTQKQMLQSKRQAAAEKRKARTPASRAPAPTPAKPAEKPAS